MDMSGWLLRKIRFDNPPNACLTVHFMLTHMVIALTSGAFVHVHVVFVGAQTEARISVSRQRSYYASLRKL